MVFKNKLTFLNGEKKPVLEIELGIFKLDKIEELKTFVLSLKEDQATAEVKRGLNDLYEGNESTKFNAFDGIRATLQAEKVEDPKLGNITNEKLDTQSAEIAAMQEHLEVIRFKESDDKPDLKKTVSDDVKVEKTDKKEGDETKKPEEKVEKDVGIDKALFLKDSPVSDSFKKLHEGNFTNLNEEKAKSVEATGEASDKEKDISKTEVTEAKDEPVTKEEEEDEDIKKGSKGGKGYNK